MKWIQFNLNDYVKVKIKDKGYEYQIEQDKKVLGGSNFKIKTIKQRKKKEDSEGYTEMQAHVFISEFGKLGMRLDQYIDINILIGDKE